jgi:predicted metal-dependent phosphoesterase TrpH
LLLCDATSTISLSVIDLHTHTTASDGLLSPAHLVEKAGAEGITVLAITDHDTVSGLPEAREAADQGRAGHAIEVIPGIEISVEFEPGTCHLLGLFIDPGNPALCAELDDVVESRNERNRIIAGKLNRMGVPIRLTDVIETAGEGSVGRPHFARVMIDMRVVRDTNEAFSRFLRKGGPAYEGRYRTAPARAIPLIHGAGGVAVLCHPHTLCLGEGAVFREYLGALAAMGLDALEAHYGEYTASERERYGQMAADCGLLLSGGSDFHAESFCGRRLGCGRFGIPVPAEVLSPLRQRAAFHRGRS